MRATQSQVFLPLFKFPTKVVLVDDNLDFVKSLEMLFSPRGIDFIVFTNPKEALEYLQQRKYCEFANEYLNLKNNEEIFSKNINVNLRSLYQEIYDPNRFNEITVLMVDFSMPEMTGQEICQETNNLPIQKLLLTGEASFEKAVEMFNNKIINAFVTKDEDLEVLFEKIKQLQNKYFQNITENLLFALKSSSGSSIFTNKDFIEFFTSLCKTNNFIEYYAIDESGSYLLADKAGTVKLLIVKNEEDMQVSSELAEGDANITQDALASLRKREKIVFFQLEEDLILPFKDWNLYDAKTIESDETYYYALVDVDGNFRLDRNKITWYQDYLKNRKS